MKQERPILIVTSCTRNYGWVTGAFLEDNTRWADYIVIVDQMSTDATRPLINEYNEKRGDGIHRAKIVIVDDADMSYKENTRAKMAFMKGRELAAGRDAIFFALDIDEMLSANWQGTEDGQKILTSKPGDMFQLEWANIMPDGRNFKRSGWQYKVFHDNGMEWQECDIQIHTPLLPYSSWDENKVYYVHDFPMLHFGVYHERWNQYKQVYYQFVDILQHRSKSVISLYRKYHYVEENDVKPLLISQEWLFKDVDIIGLVDRISTPIFVDYIKDIIAVKGVDKFQPLDVWSDELCQLLGIDDPRSKKWKMLHRYLKFTQSNYKFILWRTIDKVLKQLC